MTTTTWERAEAARLRARADEIAAVLARVRGRKGKTERERVARLARAWLDLRRDAARLAPVAIEICADEVRAARNATRCPYPGCRHRPRHNAILCPSCKTIVAYCWRCGRVRPLERFARNSSRQCRDCAHEHDPRPRRTPEQVAESYAVRLAAMREEARRVQAQQAQARLAALESAVVAAGGVPSEAVYAFWDRIGATQTPPITGNAARCIWKRNGKPRP